jgi:hypothetical protein
MSSILGALFAVLVGMLAIRPYISYEHQGMVNTEVAATAGQQRLISEAAQAYIQQNYAAVEAASTASTPAIITVPMLESTGFLPTSMTSTNPYGQTWEVQVLQPSAGNLQALVLSTGGRSIPQSQAPAIAAQTGQEGGFIPYAGQYGSASSGTAMGAYGGWSVSMAGYANPGAGHLASLVAFTNGNLQNDYLYRVAVPGQPQLNTMQTNINMGQNYANNASGYYANSPDNTNTAGMGGTNSNVDVSVRNSDGDNDLMNVGKGYAYSSVNGSTAYGNYAETSANAGTTYTSVAGPSAIGNGVQDVGDSAGNASTTEFGPSSVGNIATLVAQSNGRSYVVLNSTKGTGSSAWMDADPTASWLSMSAGSAPGDTANLYVWNNAGVNAFNASSTGEVSASKQFDLPTIATLGGACTPNGAIAASSSGALLSCVNGVWASNSAFAATHQMGISNGTYYQNTGATPAFIATWCNNTPNSSGYGEEVDIYVTTPGGGVLSETRGRVAEGGSDANFAAAPSASAIVPPGDDFMVNGQNMSCSLAFTQ